MTDDDIERQKTDALYEFYLAAQRFYKIKNRALKASAAMTNIAVILRNDPCGILGDNESGMIAEGTVSVSALSELSKEYGHAKELMTDASIKSRRLGVDPIVLYPDLKE